MRLGLRLAAALCCLGLAVRPVQGDDLKINTPVVSANLTGRWELQTDDAGKFKQTLHLGPQLTGHWQRSRESLPVTIAWFVEGGELRILYYHEPDGAFNYRVKTLMVPYKLSDETLKLILDGKSTTWKRLKEVQSDKR